MKRYIGKIIIVLIIFLGILFAWKLKNTEKANVNNESNIVQNEKVEEPNVEDKEPEKVEEPKIENKEPEKVEEPKIENKEPEKVEEPKIEDKEPEKIDEPVINVDDPNFDLVVNSLDLEILKSYKLPILIDFGAEECMPCKMMEPALHEAHSELRGKAIIKFVDVWQYPDAAEGFNFSLIPTQFYFDKDGNLQGSHTGALTKEEIISILKEMGMEE